RDGHAGVVEQHEAVPLLPDPARVCRLVAEPRVLLHRAVLPVCALAPHTAIHVIVLEGSSVARLEALFREQRRSVAPRASDEVDLALFAGLDDTQARIPVGTGDEPVAGKQVA